MRRSVEFVHGMMPFADGQWVSHLGSTIILYSSVLVSFLVLISFGEHAVLTVAHHLQVRNISPTIEHQLWEVFLFLSNQISTFQVLQTYSWRNPMCIGLLHVMLRYALAAIVHINCI